MDRDDVIVYLSRAQNRVIDGFEYKLVRPDATKQAIKLLKEHRELKALRNPEEPKAVLKIKRSDYMYGGYCPACGVTVFSVYNNCPSCSKALLWEIPKDGEQK